MGRLTSYSAAWKVTHVVEQSVETRNTLPRAQATNRSLSGCNKRTPDTRPEAWDVYTHV